jgi:DNA-directed RNA polymerase sigma subunit (sigma70/sigma32)
MNKKARLSRRESEVIRRVFGQEDTAVSIAKDFRCHETLIFQIKTSALAKLRALNLHHCRL